MSVMHFTKERCKPVLQYGRALNFSQTRAKVAQAEAERNQVKHQGEAARLLILFEVEEAYRNFIVEKAALEAQDESLRLSREWLLTEMNNFEFDLGDTENLVRAVQTSLQLEAAYYEAVQRHNVAVLRLLDACGVLAAINQSPARSLNKLEGERQ